MPDHTPSTRPTSGAAFDTDRISALLGEGWQSSVWLTGQTCSRDQRRGRYTPVSITHPAKMLPTIARYAIHTYTQPGDLVTDARRVGQFLAPEPGHPPAGSEVAQTHAFRSQQRPSGL